MPNKKPISLDKIIRLILVIGGAIGLACAFTIMYEKLQLLQNTSYEPPCNLNPIISCGSVMKSTQSHIFGFPNPLIGLVAFPVLITTGMAMFAGATFKRWFWLGIQAGTIFGLGLVHWLFFQSVYRIGALCPYCVVVWVVTITTFWYVLLYNIEQTHVRLKGRLAAVATFARGHHFDILVVWFLIIAALILEHFWYYYGQHL